MSAKRGDGRAAASGANRGGVVRVRQPYGGPLLPMEHRLAASPVFFGVKLYIDWYYPIWCRLFHPPDVRA